MAATPQTRSSLSALYITGAIPTQDDFEKLIKSTANLEAGDNTFSQGLSVGSTLTVNNSSGIVGVGTSTPFSDSDEILRVGGDASVSGALYYGSLSGGSLSATEVVTSAIRGDLNFNTTGHSTFASVDSTGSETVSGNLDVAGTTRLAGTTIAGVVNVASLSSVDNITIPDPVGASHAATKNYVDTQVDTKDTLAELDDTLIASQSNNQILAYQSSSGKFENKNLSDINSGTNQDPEFTGTVKVGSPSSIDTPSISASHSIVTQQSLSAAGMLITDNALIAPAAFIGEQFINTLNTNTLSTTEAIQSINVNITSSDGNQALSGSIKQITLPGLSGVTSFPSPLSAQKALSAQEIHVANNLIIGTGEEFSGGLNRGIVRSGSSSVFNLVIDGIEAFGNHNLNGNLDVVGTTTKSGSIKFDGSGGGLAAGNTGIYQYGDISETKIINLTGLGPYVKSSSLTGVGTIEEGVWNATQIQDHYLGNLSATKIVGGTLSDSVVAASNVTQHQHNITNVGQLTGLNMPTADLVVRSIDNTGVLTCSGGISTSGDISGDSLTLSGPLSTSGILSNQTSSAGLIIRGRDEPSAGPGGKIVIRGGEGGESEDANGNVEIGLTNTNLVDLGSTRASSLQVTGNITMEAGGSEFQLNDSDLRGTGNWETDGYVKTIASSLEAQGIFQANASTGEVKIGLGTNGGANAVLFANGYTETLRIGLSGDTELKGTLNDTISGGKGADAMSFLKPITIEGSLSAASLSGSINGNQIIGSIPNSSIQDSAIVSKQSAITNTGILSTLKISDKVVQDNDETTGVNFGVDGFVNILNAGTTTLTISSNKSIVDGESVADSFVGRLSGDVAGQIRTPTQTVISNLPNVTNVGALSSLTITGDLTVNGTTNTLSSTNTVISDNIIGLNEGVALVNPNDSGIIIERGTSGDNAALIWDESEDAFLVGTTANTSSDTGSLTVSQGDFIAGSVKANLSGDIAGLVQTPTQTVITSLPNVTNVGTLTSIKVDDALSTSNNRLSSHTSITNLLTSVNVDIENQATVKLLSGTDVHITNKLSATNIDVLDGTLFVKSPGPQVILKDSTDDDDHKIYFRSHTDNTIFELTTESDNINFGSVADRPIYFKTNNIDRIKIENDTTAFRNVLSAEGQVKITADKPADSRGLVMRSSNSNNPGLNLHVEGTARVGHDFFKRSGFTGGFADGSNHFHEITEINLIQQQDEGDVKNLERVQERYYAVQDDLVRGNAAFWEWNRVARPISVTEQTTTNATLSVTTAQYSPLRSAHKQIAFPEGGTQPIALNLTDQSGTWNLSANDYVRLTFGTGFAGPIVAGQLFGKVSSAGSDFVNVKLYEGNYKTTVEVTSATAGRFALSAMDFDAVTLETIGTSTLVNESNKTFLAPFSGADVRPLPRANEEVIKASWSTAHGLRHNEHVTILTDGRDDLRVAEDGFVIDIDPDNDGGKSALIVYGRRVHQYNFNHFATLSAGGGSDPDDWAIHKGSIDGIHRENIGDQIFNFNADKNGDYTSFQIGPGAQSDTDNIAIGHNVYNNDKGTVKIGFLSGGSTNFNTTLSAGAMLDITPTGINVGPFYQAPNSSKGEYYGNIITNHGGLTAKTAEFTGQVSISGNFAAAGDTVLVNGAEFRNDITVNNGGIELSDTGLDISGSGDIDMASGNINMTSGNIGTGGTITSTSTVKRPVQNNEADTNSIRNMRQLTQIGYNALSASGGPDASTMYVIIG